MLESKMKWIPRFIDQFAFYSIPQSDCFKLAGIWGNLIDQENANGGGR